MKTLSKFFCLIWIVASCTDLEVPVVSELTPANFPIHFSQYDAATGGVYSTINSEYCTDYWRLQEFSTDEAGPMEFTVTAAYLDVDFPQWAENPLDVDLKWE